MQHCREWPFRIFLSYFADNCLEIEEMCADINKFFICSQFLRLIPTEAKRFFFHKTLTHEIFINYSTHDSSFLLRIFLISHPESPDKKKYGKFAFNSCFLFCCNNVVTSATVPRVEKGKSQNPLSKFWNLSHFFRLHCAMISIFTFDLPLKSKWEIFMSRLALFFAHPLWVHYFNT